MPVFYSPTGNAEVWDECPEGYVSEAEWDAARNKEIAETEAAYLAEYNSIKARANRLRDERNKRLTKTDYLMMPDYPLTEEFKEALIAYRQALRDLPAQEGAPWDGGEEDTPWPKYPDDDLMVQ